MTKGESLLEPIAHLRFRPIPAPRCRRAQRLGFAFHSKVTALGVNNNPKCRVPRGVPMFVPIVSIPEADLLGGDGIGRSFSVCHNVLKSPTRSAAKHRASSSPCGECGARRCRRRAPRKKCDGPVVYCSNARHNSACFFHRAREVPRPDSGRVVLSQHPKTRRNHRPAVRSTVARCRGEWRLNHERRRG